MNFSVFAFTTTLACVASLSAAQAVTFDETQNLTETGQDLVFTFDDLPDPAGAATVTIATGGSQFIPGIDLSGVFAFDDEYFEATLDGTSLGFFSCGGPSSIGATVIPGTEGNSDVFDCEFSLPLAVGAEETTAALSDGQAVIGVLFGPGVDAFFDADEVVVSLSYDTMAAVPLPASLPLLGAGLAGLALARRRRRG